MNTFSWKNPAQMDPQYDRSAEPYADHQTLPLPQTAHSNPLQNLQNQNIQSALGQPLPNLEHMDPPKLEKLEPVHIGPQLAPMAPRGDSAQPTPAPPSSASPDSEQKNSRRLLSATKRAAQNRNAQKAFRERKEKYVKELEATAAEVAGLHKTIAELRQENMQLRDYTLALQSRLIELGPQVTQEQNHAP